MCVNTRFNAEHTIVGDIATSCQELTKRVLALGQTKHEHKPPFRTDSKSRQEGMSEEQIRSMWDYMAYGSPSGRQMEDQVYSSQSKLPSLEVDIKEDKDLLDDTDALWDHIHSKKVRFLVCRVLLVSIPPLAKHSLPFYRVVGRPFGDQDKGEHAVSKICLR